MNASSEGTRPRVTIIATGAANLASVKAALRRAGAEPVLATRAAEVNAAERLLLPGVGAFGPARERLAAWGVDGALVARARAGVPLLAICLGMQLLADGSEEALGVPGLGLLPGTVRRLDDAPCLPHMGWNRVAVEAPARGASSPAARLLEDGYAAFANSFALVDAPTDAVVGRTTHGAPFVSAVERGSLLACQFHPELSGAWGAALLARWLALPAAAPGTLADARRSAPDAGVGAGPSVPATPPIELASSSAEADRC